MIIPRGPLSCGEACNERTEKDDSPKNGPVLLGELEKENMV